MKSTSARDALIIVATIMLLAPVTGCPGVTLDGELVLTPPPGSVGGAIFQITLWRYDPFLADAAADRVAQLTITDATSAPVPFSFTDLGAPEAGYEYYITAAGDLDGDGTRTDGDYYPSDFGAVDTSSGSWSFTQVDLAPITVSEQACPGAQEHGAPFAEALSAWRDLRDSHGSIYRYISEWSSFSGTRSRTVINVEDEIVTSRSHQIWDVEGVLIEEWSEDGAEVGRHAEGAPALTLDGVYDTCCADLSRSLLENTLYFDVDEETGVLATCLYVPHGCADDCSEGARVSDVAFAVDRDGN